MNKILLSHYGNRATVERFARLLSAQSRFAEALAGVDRLYITDRENGFDPGFRVVRTEFLDAGRVRFAAIKNVALEYAARNCYDWWIEGDSDRFLARCPMEFPATGYGCIRSYCSHPGQSVDEIVSLYRAGRLAFGGSFFFVLRKDVFSRHRFCEEYLGFAFEDVDYRENVLAAAGVHESPNDGLGIHLSHPLGDAKKRRDEAMGGKAIYRRRQWACGRQDIHTILSPEEAAALDLQNPGLKER